MESYRQVYQEMISLLIDSKSIDPKMLGYVMSFRSKMFSFEMMYRKTLQHIKELEEIYKRESAQGKILLEETGRAWNKSVAFFEAYLNAFYSLLQIIAKITPYFYGNEKSKIFPSSKYFGRLIDYLKKHPSIDTDFSSYLKERVRWYETLRNNRHMITHEGSAFLGFGQDGKIIFIDYPEEGFSWFQPNKSTKDLESYLTQSFADLFEFLEFYVKHFRQRAKST